MTTPLRFSLILFAATVILAGITFALQSWLHLFISSPILLVGAFAFFYLLFVLVYAVSAYGLKKNQQTFTTMTVGGIGMKFFFSLGFILVYLIFAPKTDKAFVILLLIVYLFYSVFEIYFLLTNLRHIFNKK